MNICETCHKEFEKASDIKSIRFCCEHCRRVYIGKHSRSTCKQSGNHIRGHRPAKTGGWRCLQCGEIFRTRREKQKHNKEKHGRVKAWNCGLTAETCDIIKKSREVFMDRYRTGKIKKFAVPKERRDKISKGVSKWLLSDSYDTHFKRVKRYFVKNLDGVEYKCQGKWEKSVAEKFNALGIKWIRGEPIRYKVNGVTHRYSPDFYIPSENRYVEVKGYYSTRDRIKMKAVVEQHPTMEIYFIDCKKYDKFISGKIDFSLKNFPVWW